MQQMQGPLDDVVAGLKPPTNEAELQRQIRLVLGQTPGVVIWRNQVGKARHEKAGRVWFVPYGLCVGSSDLIGMAGGRFLAVEIKYGRGRLSKAQKLFLNLVNRQGGYGCVARSVVEALSHAMRAMDGGKLGNL